MRKFDVRDPAHSAPMSLLAQAEAFLRVAVHRCFPLKWVLRGECSSTWIRSLCQPQRTRRVQRLVAAFIPASSGRELQRAVALSMTIRRIGAQTYAPVFQRSHAWLLRVLRPEGLHHLEEARRLGRGGIVLGTGIGLKAWVAPVLRQLGYPVRPMQRVHLDGQSVLLRRWEGVAMQVLPYPEGPDAGIHLKRLHNLLRRGEWIQYPGQVPEPTKGICCSYRERDVKVSVMPWGLARLTGAPLIPAVLLVDASLDLRLIVGPAILVNSREAPLDAMREACQTYQDFLSRLLHHMPWNQHLSSHLRELLLSRGAPSSLHGKATARLDGVP